MRIGLGNLTVRIYWKEHFAFCSFNRAAVAGRACPNYPIFASPGWLKRMDLLGIVDSERCRPGDDFFESRGCLWKRRLWRLVDHRLFEFEFRGCPEVRERLIYKDLSGF